MKLSLKMDTLKTYRKFISFTFFLLLGAILSNCGDDVPPIIDSQEAGNNALEIVSGQVLGTELDSAGTITEWDVTILTAGGSEVKVELDQMGGGLIEVEGEEAPFDYEVDPGMGLISFSEARLIALTETDGEIKKWKLKKDDSGKWIYDFDMLQGGQEVEIKIDAATGAVI